MNIKILKKLTEIVSLKALCFKAGLNSNTINSKIIHNRELKVDEAEKLKSVLIKYGFNATLTNHED